MLNSRFAISANPRFGFLHWAPCTILDLSGQSIYILPLDARQSTDPVHAVMGLLKSRRKKKPSGRPCGLKLQPADTGIASPPESRLFDRVKRSRVLPSISPKERVVAVFHSNKKQLLPCIAVQN